MRNIKPIVLSFFIFLLCNVDLCAQPDLEIISNYNLTDGTKIDRTRPFVLFFEVFNSGTQADNIQTDSRIYQNNSLINAFPAIGNPSALPGNAGGFVQGPVVNPINANLGPAEIDVYITADGEIELGDNFLTRPVEFVEGSGDVLVEILQPADGSEILAGAISPLELRLTNVGGNPACNLRIQSTLFQDGQPFAASIEPSPISELGPGESTSFIFPDGIPNNLPVGTYTIQSGNISLTDLRTNPLGESVFNVVNAICPPDMAPTAINFESGECIVVEEDATIPVRFSNLSICDAFNVTVTLEYSSSKTAGFVEIGGTIINQILAFDSDTIFFPIESITNDDAVKNAKFRAIAKTSFDSNVSNDTFCVIVDIKPSPVQGIVEIIDFQFQEGPPQVNNPFTGTVFIRNNSDFHPLENGVFEVALDNASLLSGEATPFNGSIPPGEEGEIIIGSFEYVNPLERFLNGTVTYSDNTDQIHDNQSFGFTSPIDCQDDIIASRIIIDDPSCVKNNGTSEMTVEVTFASGCFAENPEATISVTDSDLNQLANNTIPLEFRDAGTFGTIVTIPNTLGFTGDAIVNVTLSVFGESVNNQGNNFISENINIVDESFDFAITNASISGDVVTIGSPFSMDVDVSNSSCNRTSQGEFVFTFRNGDEEIDQIIRGPGNDILDPNSSASLAFDDLILNFPFNVGPVSAEVCYSNEEDNNPDNDCFYFEFEYVCQSDISIVSTGLEGGQCLEPGLETVVEIFNQGQCAGDNVIMSQFLETSIGVFESTQEVEVLGDASTFVTVTLPSIPGPFEEPGTYLIQVESFNNNGPVGDYVLNIDISNYTAGEVSCEDIFINIPEIIEGEPFSPTMVYLNRSTCFELQPFTYTLDFSSNGNLISTFTENINNPLGPGESASYTIPNIILNGDLTELNVTATLTLPGDPIQSNNSFTRIYAQCPVDLAIVNIESSIPEGQCSKPSSKDSLCVTVKNLSDCLVDNITLDLNNYDETIEVNVGTLGPNDSTIVKISIFDRDVDISKDVELTVYSPRVESDSKNNKAFYNYCIEPEEELSDLEVISIDNTVAIVVGEEYKVLAELRNKSEFFDAEDISVSVTFRNGRYEVVKEMSIPDIPKNSGIIPVSFNVQLTGLDLNPEEMEVELSAFDPRGDAGESDNTKSVLIPVSDPRLSFLKSVDGFKRYVEDNIRSNDNLLVYANPDIRFEGTDLFFTQYPDSPDYTTTVDSWVAFVDPNHMLRYEKDIKVLVMDAFTGDIQEFEGNNWLTVDGQVFPSTDLDDNYAIIGVPTIDYVAYESTPDIPAVGPPSNENIQFIGITGASRSERESLGFNYDVKVIADNLMLEENGPRISERDITILENPSLVEIRELINGLSMDLDRVYLVYSGHGANSTPTPGFILKDELYSYNQLLDDLLTNVKTEYNIIVESSFGNEVIEEFLSSGNYDSNVKIISSTGYGQNARMNPLSIELNDGSIVDVQAGRLMIPFGEGYGKNETDKDGNANTSLRETYNWVFENNQFDDLTIQGPVYFNWNYKEMQQETDLIENVLSSSLISGFDNNDKLNTGIEINGSKAAGEKDETVFNVSGNRLFMLETDNTEPFELNLTFNINDIWDEFTGDGVIGIATRENKEATWTAHYPSLHNSTTNQVTAESVTHFSQWALGNVVDGSSNTEDLEFLEFKAYPNPFQDAMVLNFRLQESKNIMINLSAVTGMHSSLLFRGKATAGNNHLVIDRNNIPAGVYILSISSNEKILKSTKVIIQ